MKSLYGSIRLSDNFDNVNLSDYLYDEQYQENTVARK